MFAEHIRFHCSAFRNLSKSHLKLTKSYIRIKKTSVVHKIEKILNLDSKKKKKKKSNSYNWNNTGKKVKNEINKQQ
jgi:hypothetical protein